eukprot:UN18233
MFGGSMTRSPVTGGDRPDYKVSHSIDPACTSGQTLGKRGFKPDLVDSRSFSYHDPYRQPRFHMPRQQNHLRVYRGPNNDRSRDPNGGIRAWDDYCRA